MCTSDKKMSGKKAVYQTEEMKIQFIFKNIAAS